MLFYADYFSKNYLLELDINVTRTEYTVDPGTILSSCSLSAGQRGCTLEVPATSNIGLVDLHTTESVAQFSSISIQADCNPRIWVAVTISSVFMVLYTLFVVTFMVCCYFCLCRKRNNKYTPLSPLSVDRPTPAPYSPLYGSTGPPPPAYF